MHAVLGALSKVRQAVYVQHWTQQSKAEGSGARPSVNQLTTTVAAAAAPTSWKMPVPCHPSPMVPLNWLSSRSRNRSLGNWPAVGLGSGPLRQGDSGGMRAA